MLGRKLQPAAPSKPVLRILQAQAQSKGLQLQQPPSHTEQIPTGQSGAPLQQPAIRLK